LDPFQLAGDAILDIDAIWLYLLEKDGVETADRIVTDLFKGFYKLVEVPNSGHRRTDLTNRKVLFYRVFSYLVIYEPGSNPLLILGVLHGKRNVARILRQRL
jgi:plasmid stabilization system protein ParE